MSNLEYTRKLEKLLLDIQETLQNHAEPDYPTDAPEYFPIQDICERYGYGAVMACASSQWVKSLEAKGYPKEGAFISGPCIGTIQRLLQSIDETVK